MRAVVQRVSRCRVTLQETGEVAGEIGVGLLVLLGVSERDAQADADWLATKIVKLRIFDDAEGKLNLSLAQVGGAVLAVSQFTLYGDARGQNRPSYIRAARPKLAQPLYDYFVTKIRELGFKCETGRFQQQMFVELLNWGPVTIMLDSEKLF
jgi:D-tyrosyl-tRNA(Tyr) deacylase